MLLYRVVTRKEHALLNGKGAAKSNTNRWNSRGTELIYTSETKELALAEINGYVPVGLLPDPHLMIIEYDPEQLIDTLSDAAHPIGWSKIPPAAVSRLVGDRFVNERSFVALRVRSRHGSSAYGNLLLNPNHPAFSRLVRVKEVRPLKPAL